MCIVELYSSSQINRREDVMKPNIDFIKAEMDKHHWSGSQLAMKMGVSRMEVSRLLRGKRVGGKKCIGGLIRAFPNASLDDLFFWTKWNLLFT